MQQDNDMYVVFKINQVNGKRHIVSLADPNSNMLVPLVYQGGDYWRVETILSQIQDLANQCQSCFELVKFKQSDIVQLFSPQKKEKELNS